MLSNGIHFALRKIVTAIEYTLTAGQKLFTFALYGSESLLKNMILIYQLTQQIIYIIQVYPRVSYGYNHEEVEI